ncbi:MAG: hypothetical protein WKF51_07185 [Geodermatophilaceae bacterium]
MPELQRRSREVAARHNELTAKRTTLAAERTALAHGNLLHRRVTDFANQIRGVIDQLDRAQRQQLMRLLIEDVHVTGSHVQIQLRIPLDPPDPGSAGPRRTGPKPTGARSVSSQDRLRSAGDPQGRQLPAPRTRPRTHGYLDRAGLTMTSQGGSIFGQHRWPRFQSALTT